MKDPFVYNIISLITLSGGSLLVSLFAREPWHKSSFGRAFMALAVSLTAFALASSLRLWLGDAYWGRQYVRFTSNTIAAAGVWSAFWVLLKARRKGRHAEAPPRRRSTDLP